ncbi:MAG: hypothetical protein P8X90_31460 [Desulfobacterales bacterium]
MSFMGSEAIPAANRWGCFSTSSASSSLATRHNSAATSGGAMEWIGGEATETTWIYSPKSSITRKRASRSTRVGMVRA